jgi:class 3 adenylate cyclase
VDETGATQEIEETLQLARQAAELQIARYRVWTFGFVFAISSLVTLFAHRGQLGAFWIGPALWGALAAYALAWQRWIDRHGASNRLAYLSIVVDVVGVAIVFSRIPNNAYGTLLVVHVAIPTFLLVQICHLLRSDGRASMLAGFLVAVLMLPVFLLHEPPNPYIFCLPLGAVLVGLIGAATARQTRRNLETFARLQLLRRYLPQQAVERVMRDDPDAALSLGGRSLTLTLLSTDLRGFTALSEKLAPDEVVRQLNAYHGTMLAAVERHGGALDKFIGDGALVVFGLPIGPVEAPPDCGAAAAVACAKDMLAALERHNADRQRDGQGPLRMGIGVHTGPVVAGNIGAPGKRLEFTVIGDAVNTAARLEGLTKEAGTPLLISAETVARLPNAGGLSELAPMRAKGKEELLRVFGVGVG